MPGTMIVLFALALTVLYPIVDYAWSWPRMKRSILAPGFDRRVPVYGEIIATLWGLSLVAVGLIVAGRHPWSALGLTLPHGFRLGIAIGLVLAMGALLLVQQSAVAKLTPERRRRVRERMGELELIVPHSERERVWFRAVSVTAGICEELLYRGFLVWALRPWLGLWGSAALSAASFTLAHAYQGRRYLPRVAVVGSLLGLLAIATGSVIPGMVIHAMIDLVSGEVTFRLNQDAVTA